MTEETAKHGDGGTEANGEDAAVRRVGLPCRRTGAAVSDRKRERRVDIDCARVADPIQPRASPRDARRTAYLRGSAAPCFAVASAVSVVSLRITAGGPRG